MRVLTARSERWPLAAAFVISRGAKTEAEVVVVELADGPHRGRGEAVAYPRYGETTEGVLAEIEGVRVAVEAGATRASLQDMLPAGAARNAIDCALWDLEAKRAGLDPGGARAAGPGQDCPDHQPGRARGDG